MAQEAGESIDAILGFDANLPKMEGCGRNCRNVKMVMCKHRFSFNPRMVYYNTPKFYGVSDSEILLHFLEHIRNNVAAGNVSPGCVFMMLTKDHDFLRDAEQELGKKGKAMGLVFSKNYVIFGGIIVFVLTVDCRGQGRKKMDDRTCAVHKANRFFQNMRM